MMMFVFEMTYQPTTIQIWFWSNICVEKKTFFCALPTNLFASVGALRNNVRQSANKL